MRVYAIDREMEAIKNTPIYITDFMIDPITGKEDLSKPTYDIRVHQNADTKELLEKTIEYLDKIKRRRINEEW